MLCTNCAMQSSEVIMQCECTNILTGGKTSSSVNLSKHLSVSGTHSFVKFSTGSADPSFL